MTLTMPVVEVIHSLFRWVVLILAVVALVMLVIGLIQKAPFTKTDRILTMLYSTSVDIQVLLGIITLIVLGINQVRLEHAGIMVLAVIAVHIPARWRNAPDPVRFRNTLIAFVISIVLIIIGVAIVNGWVK